MKAWKWLAACSAAFMLFGCTSGSGSSGGFALIEFLESGQNNIPRNRQIRFLFSQPVAPGQDLFTRLKIQNVKSEAGSSNFARAQGFYQLNAELVIFTPRLPNKPDRSDAGFKADGNYVVFLSGGPDGLTSTEGDRIPTQQEFIFETNEFFEDIIPAEPPRAIELLAIDPTGATATVNISRVDPRPFEQAQKTTQDLLDEGNIIEPGAGGGPNYSTPWRFELRVSETLDPSTINGNTVQLYEIRENVFDTPPATPGAGNPAGSPLVPAFRVSATVETVQSIDPATGDYDIRIRVTPLQTLVDNTRYRITFGGKILGVDFRKTFSGDNGLTGDGETLTPEGVYEEPGGLGYVSEFLVYDRNGISAFRKLLYDPFIDGIEPETGQTANSEDDLNSALYNPVQDPGKAVGFLSAFGSGVDGPFAAAASSTLDTGDTPNEPLGNPFTVNDLNPNDDYLNNTLPGGPLTYDSVEPFELEVESLTVSSSATLRIEGVNPIMFRVAGLVQITGTINIAGEDGRNGGGTFAAGGLAGAGGFNGADTKQGDAASCSYRAGSCSNFVNYLNNCTNAKNLFPASINGNGPGRGLAGGEKYTYYARDNKPTHGGTGGGGASHGESGTAGEDRRNAAGATGTGGPSCSDFANVRNSGVIGVRGQPGPIYGDREILLVNMGGSGGGSGGSSHTYQFGSNQQAGGGGGGGGGSLMIVASGSILVQGGQIYANGGAGGKGGIKGGTASRNWDSVTGGGGGGSGGSIGLISGDNIDLSAAIISAEGGLGGPRANDGLTVSCNACNAGGDGGPGFIFLMDADGDITGFLPQGGESAPGSGEYDNDPRGILTIKPFDATRFSSITAITELFPMTAAKPAYVQYDPGADILGNVFNAEQFIYVNVSAALSNPEDPTVADPASEIPNFEIARLEAGTSGTAVVVTGSMANLNATAGVADRRAFVRVRALFDYRIGVQAALGPFASMDEVKISYNFNG